MPRDNVGCGRGGANRRGWSSEEDAKIVQYVHYIGAHNIRIAHVHETRAHHSHGGHSCATTMRWLQFRG